MLNNGFIRFDDYGELYNKFNELLSIDLNFFSSMKSKQSIGKIIEVSNIEETYEKKAEKFLELIRK